MSGADKLLNEILQGDYKICVPTLLYYQLCF
jgi:hypothetical protein